MEAFSNILSKIDDFVWGPAMLFLLVGTGVFLTIRTRALCWRNLPYAIKSVLSREARQKKGDGDVSPFSALTTALAATIGTGNIVGVATAMVSGGPGALVWMWLSAAFGITSKFSECMLAIKYREVNAQGEMSGGPMYTISKAFKHKKTGAVLAWLFALFAVLASFGIGNLTQANSISSALQTTFGVSEAVTGAVITVLALFIILGGIKSISKVSQVVVPLMAVFYMGAGLIVILGNIENLPSGVAMIFKMAFSVKAVGGGLCGGLVASMMQAMRFGIARGVFSNEAGMGSAAITAAAATTDDPVHQGYINMTGTFWDTIVVCTITGLCIASSGVLGSTDLAAQGTFSQTGNAVVAEAVRMDDGSTEQENFEISQKDGKTVLVKISTSKAASGEMEREVLTRDEKAAEAVKESKSVRTDTPAEEGSSVGTGTPAEESTLAGAGISFEGSYRDASGNCYEFQKDGTYTFHEVTIGAALTIKAFQSVLGNTGGVLVCIGIAFFAFSTILGWEYHGEKAFEYLLKSHKYNLLYRIFFSVLVFFGATTTLEIAWTFSDIANALMAIPNLISLILLSGVVVKEINRYQEKLKKNGKKQEKRKNNA